MENIELLILATITMVVGSILQASVGFGFGLVVVPLLLVIDSAFVPIPLIFASLFLMYHVAYKNRFSLAGHSIVSLILGLALGAPAGAVVLAVIESNTFIYLVSAVVLVGLLASFLNVTVKVTPTAQFIAGVTSNVLGTSTGVGGVPIALLYQNESGARIRAVLSTAFFIGSLFSIFALFVTSQITTQSLLLGGYLIPGIFIGSLLGQRCASYIDQGHSRAAILLISCASVAFLLYGVLAGNV